MYLLLLLKIAPQHRSWSKYQEKIAIKIGNTFLKFGTF